MKKQTKRLIESLFNESDELTETSTLKFTTSQAVEILKQAYSLSKNNKDNCEVCKQIFDLFTKEENLDESLSTEFTADDAKELADKHNNLNETAFFRSNIDTKPEYFDVDSAKKLSNTTNDNLINTLKLQAINYIKDSAKRGDYSVKIPAPSDGHIYKHNKIVLDYLHKLKFSAQYTPSTKTIDVFWG